MRHATLVYVACMPSLPWLQGEKLLLQGVSLIFTTCQQQPDEPPLYPAWLNAFNGNNSLKCVDGLGHADECCFTSSYLIPPAEVEQFKNDVRLCLGTCPVTQDPHQPSCATEHVDDSTCTDNWKATNTTSEHDASLFEQTGVFVSACCHGIIQTLVEMRQSGELYIPYLFNLIVWYMIHIYKEQSMHLLWPTS